VRTPFALADREAGGHPDPGAYATHGEYLAAWDYWRAVRRDAYPTDAELDARWDAQMWKLGPLR
jgi:hypothetical protein